MIVARTLSPGKINLGLEILGKRTDGYHEIRTVMQAISLSDEVGISLNDRHSLHGNVPSLDYDGNLASRAARLWSEQLDPEHRQIGVSLRKSIPIAAGLGGASSNAAAVLLLADTLFGTNVGAETLASAAATLGSDVPFFLGSTAALASGRGEMLTPLPALSGLHFVLATPDVEIPRKTVAMYGRLKPGDFSDGSSVQALAAGMTSGFSPEAEHLRNAFERPLLEFLPELERIPTLMRSFAGQRVALSGAGPTWYAVVDSFEEATRLAAKLRERLPSARVETAQALTDRPEIEFIDDRNDPGASRV
jgi:4-diphosphocytidyl-2-C-methyl-D-erythritol kinase